MPNSIKETNNEQNKTVVSILKKNRKEFIKIKNEKNGGLNERVIFPSYLNCINKILDICNEEDKKNDIINERTNYEK